MSAFLVGDDTIDTIVTYVAGCETSCYGKFDLTTPEGKTAFGQTLLKMNGESLRQRYGDNEPLPVYTYDGPACGMPTQSKVQTFKSIRCFLYQCAEGDVPRKRLFKDIDRMSMNLAHSIINDLPEYETAVWG